MGLGKKITAKETGIYRLLTTFCHTHRSVLYSTIIKEASSYSRWELTERTVSRKMWRVIEILKMSVLTGVLRELSWRGSKKILNIRGEEWYQGNCLPSSRLTHLWTHRDCGNMHKACTDPSQTGSQWWKEVVWKCPTNNQESIWNWQPLIKEKLVLSNGVLLGIIITLKGTPHA